MNNSIKKKAYTLLKEFKLQTVTLDALRSIIEQQGYTIVEFNSIFNDKPVETLLDALNLQQYALQSKGFTYADSKLRVVFIHKDLSYEEKRIVLAHEEGHIYCNHFSSSPILGRDVMEEHEANEFAHYLLQQRPLQQFVHWMKKRKKSISIFLTALLLLTGCHLTYTAIHKEQSYFGEFYITSTGTKYHEKDCIFIKHKDNVERLTQEQFDSGAYEPCDICLPHGSP